MKNPFMEEADWKKFVKDYQVPAAVAKAHGKKVVGLHKAFKDAGLEAGGNLLIVSTAADAAKEFVLQAARVTHDFERALDLDAQLPQEINHKIKKRCVTLMRNPIESVNQFLKKMGDPFSQSRANAQQAYKEYTAWANDKSNARLLVDMFGQGLRNHLGADINAPRGKLSDEVQKLVNEYQELCKEWYQVLLNEGEAAKVLKDPPRRHKVETDMKRLVTLGALILQKTEP